MIRRIVFAIVLAMVCDYLAPAQGQEMAEMPERPTRPEKFQSPEQIAKYLKQLQAFYGVNGRGRYGKRFASLDSVESAHQQPSYRRLQPNFLPDRSEIDMIDMLRRYAYE